MTNLNININKEFYIHKDGVGKIRENCIYATSTNEVPNFLIEDSAITINSDNTITLYAAEGPATRSFPVYICWESVSEQNKDKVPGTYGTWPKDNGDTTLKVIDGKCYNLPAMIKAVLMTDELPSFIQEAGFPVVRNGENWELTRTDWGRDVRIGTIGKAFWCEYGPNDVNILSLAEPSAKEYIVTINGEDACRLVDLL